MWSLSHVETVVARLQSHPSLQWCLWAPPRLVEICFGVAHRLGNGQAGMLAPHEGVPAGNPRSRHHYAVHPQGVGAQALATGGCCQAVAKPSLLLWWQAGVRMLILGGHPKSCLAAGAEAGLMQHHWCCGGGEWGPQPY
jgi:hypothetical protein